MDDRAQLIAEIETAMIEDLKATLRPELEALEVGELRSYLRVVKNQPPLNSASDDLPTPEHASASQPPAAPKAASAGSGTVSKQKDGQPDLKEMKWE